MKRFVYRRFLIDRLDQHGDRLREAPMGVLEENNVFQPTTKQEKGTKATAHNSKDEKTKRGTKRKGTKTDPNAPKRPANPFFQFCQEQRPRVMERLAGEPEPSKQELTRQLATTWKSLSSEDKKVRVKAKPVCSCLLFKSFKCLLVRVRFRSITTCTNDPKRNMLLRCKFIIKSRKTRQIKCP